jgi:hypothetical protein
MKTKNVITNWVLRVCLALFVIFMFPTSALAQGNNVQDSVEEGEVIDHNTVLAGPVVVMNGEINGDLLAVGGKITINGQVNGNLVAAGRSIVLNGEVTGTVYIGAGLLELGPQAEVGRDLYYAGYGIKTQEGTKVSRDLNIIAVENSLFGSVGRDLHAVVGVRNLVEGLYSVITGTEWQPKGLWPNSEANPESFAPFKSSKQLLLISPVHAFDAASSFARSADVFLQESTVDTASLGEWATALLRNLAGLIILGLLLAWVAPEQLLWTGAKVQAKPWRAFLNGLFVFIFGWILAFLALVVIVLLAIFLYWISLPNLAFLFGAVGLIGLGLAVSVFVLVIVFFSKLVVAHLVGLLLFKRFLPRYAQSRFLPVLVGILLYGLAASIPYLGTLVMIFATLFGLGAIWLVANTRGQAEAKPAEDQPVVPDVQEMSLVSESQAAS